MTGPPDFAVDTGQNARAPHKSSTRVLVCQFSLQTQDKTRELHVSVRLSIWLPHLLSLFHWFVDRLGLWFCGIWYWMYWDMIGGVLAGLGWFGSKFGVSREGGGCLIRACFLEQTTVARLPDLGVYTCKVHCKGMTQSQCGLEKGQGLLLRVEKVLGTPDTPEESVFLTDSLQCGKISTNECRFIYALGQYARCNFINQCKA